MSKSELWANYVSMGGHLSENELMTAILDGYLFRPHDHDMVAQALNDLFVDVGLDHLVPYFDQLFHDQE